MRLWIFQALWAFRVTRWFLAPARNCLFAQSALLQMARIQGLENVIEIQVYENHDLRAALKAKPAAEYTGQSLQEVVDKYAQREGL